MIREYYSGWEALNVQSENGSVADWHPLNFWGDNPKKYIFNANLGDCGISKRFVSFIGKKVYVANYPRAIADLVISKNTKGLKNCVYDYLSDDEAQALYDMLKPFKDRKDIDDFLRLELTKYYLKEANNA